MATGLIAVLYVTVFAAGGVLPPGTFLRSVAQFWIGDLIGVVVTTPVLLVAAREAKAAAPSARRETIGQAMATAAALWIAFGSGLLTELKLFYVLFFPLIWIAIAPRCSRHGLGHAGDPARSHRGAQAGGFAPGAVLDFQFLMLALALTGLFLGVTVEERRAAVEKLRDKQFELDRSLRAAAASELASALAHELNQPLSAVASYARACQLMLEQPGPTPAALMPTLDKVVAEANRAGSVVRRLREFVRTGTIRQDVIAVGALLENAVAAARPRAQRNAVSLSLTVPPDLPAARGDPGRLETVLHNLIGNAIDALKATDRHRSVRLWAMADADDFVRITVADDGPGVPPDIASTLFQPLASGKSQGLGLGLAISRTIVEAHGGRLWFDAGPGGASFSFTLPRGA